MSSQRATTPGAVFISYASQDAEAARRICEALRSAGVEVWFDQSELRGGDAWDANIRRQIRDCALFVPVISANTQARREGYFRIEWKLAAQRTHAMADSTPFLLPVVIDDTRDVHALVPAEFRDVQWLWFRGGAASPEFSHRVLNLLGSSPAPTTAIFEASRSPFTLRRRSWPIPALVLALGSVAALAIWAIWREVPRPAASRNLAAQPGATVAEEVARARARLVPEHWQKEDFEVMSAIMDRLIQADFEHSDAWALRSIINSLQTVRQFDRGTKPLEIGKYAADRALRLAPNSPLGELALGLHLVAMLSRGGDDEAYRDQLDRVLAKLPRDGLTRFTELLSYYHAYDFPGAEQSANSWLAAEPAAMFPAWILSSTCLARRRPEEAEKWANAAGSESGITGVRAQVSIFEIRYYLRADLAGARAALEKVPASGRSVHRVVHAQWLLAMAEKRADDALQLLGRLPEPFFSDRTYHGPRALLTGMSHRSAGRPEAAALQFGEAERVLRQYLVNDPDNESLHAVLAVALACAGRAAEARTVLGNVEPLVSGRSPNLYRGPLVVMIAHAYREMNDMPGTARWLRKLFAEPSDIPFTPAALRYDPRFSDVIGQPEIAALLREFEALNYRPLPGAPRKEARNRAPAWRGAHLRAQAKDQVADDEGRGTPGKRSWSVISW